MAPLEREEPPLRRQPNDSLRLGESHKLPSQIPLNDSTSTVLKFTLQATQRLANANLTRGASVTVGVGMIVKNEYRIEAIGAEFRVLDCEGARVGSLS
jgi:hypothetical protein